MNKYALLCAVVISGPLFADCDRDCEGKADRAERTEEGRRTGKKLAAEAIKRTVRSGDEEEATRSSCCKCKSSCSSCCKSCSSCSKCCGCKSVEMNDEEEATKCACGKPQQKTVEAGDEAPAENRKCSSCGCTCGKCGCH